MSIPSFGTDFSVNAALLEDGYYVGKKAVELAVGVVLYKTPTESIFVGSACKKFASAMFFDWFLKNVGNQISDKNRRVIADFMAGNWNDEPGTGKHSTVDFVRDGDITVVPACEYIDDLWENRADLSSTSFTTTQREVINWVIKQLDQGKLRVAEKVFTEVRSDLPGACAVLHGEWVTHQWVKKAVLLSFRLNDNHVIDGGHTMYFDKVSPKFEGWTEDNFRNAGFRVVPPAMARKGTYFGRNVVLMPSYINIGAYVGDGTMVDTWATVGSCAQIGKNVHLSGGVGIGGVLEPIQANPTIIEDNCFIGARSEIVEGVIVEEGSVISMGVFIGQSTKIYDRETGKVSFGRVPAGSVVIAGSMPSPDGKYSLYCAVIVKKVDAQTRSKVGINELLRDI